jgi:glycosyltransferase involved in cell wall biosynthesis
MEGREYPMDYHDPKVSIVIPVYNGANFVGVAIESALAQTYRNIEILVVNDGSADSGATERIVKSFGDRVKYFKKDNGGVASALNFGIANMSGEFFSWLSHDDIYEPDKIEREIEAVRDQREGAVVYSDYFLIDENCDILETRCLPPIPAGGMRCFLTESTALHGCTLLIPRDFLLWSGGFSTMLKTTQDQDLWFRLASHYPFIHVAIPLVSVRMHRTQGSVILGDVALKEQKQLYYDFISDLNEREIYSYSGADVAFYYLRVYSRFKIVGLHRAAAVAAKRFFSALTAERHPFRILLRFVWLTLVTTRLVSRLRAKISHWLRRHDNNPAVSFVLAIREKWRE